MLHELLLESNAFLALSMVACMISSARPVDEVVSHERRVLDGLNYILLLRILLGKILPRPNDGGKFDILNIQRL